MIINKNKNAAFIFSLVLDIFFFAIFDQLTIIGNISKLLILQIGIYSKIKVILKSHYMILQGRAIS